MYRTRYDEAVDFIALYPTYNHFIKNMVIQIRFRDLSPAQVDAIIRIKVEMQRRARAS
jgi:hypothetical protein